MTITELSPLVRRITAGNSSVFTGPGTNTYLVGKEEITVIDPGPAMPEHIENIAKACGDDIKQILVTHTHPDHSPGAKFCTRELQHRLWECMPFTNKLKTKPSKLIKF